MNDMAVFFHQRVFSSLKHSLSEMGSPKAGHKAGVLSRQSIESLHHDEPFRRFHHPDMTVLD